MIRHAAIGVFAFAGGIVLVACIGGLTPAGENVRMIEVAPPSSCVDVGSVSAYETGPGAEGRLQNALLNKTAEKGGNVLQVDPAGGDGNGSGTAYKCPDAFARAGRDAGANRGAVDASSHWR